MTRAARSLQGLGSSRDGFIMVAALWLLAALAALATIASLYMAQSARALTAFDPATQSELLASAGIELAAYQLCAAATAKRPTHGGFNFRLADSDVTVGFLAESARINLNMAPKPMIAGLFRVLGAQPEVADQFADRVIGWRSAPKPNAADDEDGLYRAAGLNYSPRRAPFDSVDELWLVAGLPAVVVENALRFVTIYSGTADVNVLDAAPEVIAALPDITPLRLAAFLAERDSLPPEPDLVFGALGGRPAGAAVGGSDAYRVRVRITFPDGARKTTEGVIMILGPGEKEPFRVLSWQDEIDPSTGLPPGPAQNR